MRQALAPIAAGAAALCSAQVSLEEFERRQSTQDRAQARESRHAGAAQEARRAAQARRPGVIYKNPTYWADRAAIGVGKDVFEGSFAAIDRTDFQAFFVDYFIRFSADCRGVVERQPHVEFPSYVRTVLERRDGTIEWEGAPRHAGSVYVVTRFAATFDAFRKSPARGDRELVTLLGDLGNAMRGKGPMLPSLATRMLSTHAALRQFNAQGCESGMSQQMQENLERLALGRPSLQASDFSIATAAAESDPPPSPEEFLTLEGACLEHHLGRRLDWCKCIDVQGRNVLPPAQYRRFALSYDAFTAQLLGQQRTPADELAKLCRAPGR